MPVTAIVGANWGDEGKGKTTDFLAARSDFVVRYQGGANAGHTIINDRGTFALHLVPSGVFYEHVTNILGPGVALSVTALADELETLAAAGVPDPRLLISERACLLLPVHRQLDAWEEERLGSGSFGSTRSGIAPFYADKYLKVGVQVADLADTDRLVGRLRALLARANVLATEHYGKEPFDLEPLADSLREAGERIADRVADTTRILHDGLAAGKSVLLEGQLGALRDPDHGIYPFSTSSSTLAGFGAVGAGVPPYSIERVVCVAKSYSSCVGAGPFVTELDGSEAHELRERGGHAGEYGATTGRPRRVGWFDAVATRYGCMVQGATEVALTLLDVLSYLDEIPICVAYELDGKRIDHFPTTAVLERAKPVYEVLPGWKSDISGCRGVLDLPDEAQRYVRRVQELIEARVRVVSVGPHRDQTIEVAED